MTTLAVLIPAHDEAAYLPACLEALLSSDPLAGPVEVVVIANGCTDDTADVARGFAARAAGRGWTLRVLERAQGDKLAAWNAGEVAVPQAQVLVYLDADVGVSPPLLTQLADALDDPAPRYASGTPIVTGGTGTLTLAYRRFWQGMPFMTDGVPGFGVFAMNRAGRARWGDWPDIISDDTFARLNFAPDERHRVPARYDWPMIDGFAHLVQVRRRQDRGVAEIAQRYPALAKHADPKSGTPLWRRAAADPVGFGAYTAVRATTRLPVFRSGNRWARGR